MTAADGGLSQCGYKYGRDEAVVRVLWDDRWGDVARVLAVRPLRRAGANAKATDSTTATLWRLDKQALCTPDRLLDRGCTG